MEDIRSVKSLMTQKAFMGSLDLKDAYHVVPVHKDHRKFLRFKFLDKLYQFTCLPFGLSTSPYVFTKLMKPVMNHLRLRGIVTVIYLDDILFIHKSKKICQSNINYAKELMEHLGFIINYQKSSLIPSQECTYLGFKINSNTFCLELTDKKKIKIVELINQVYEGKRYRIRDIAKLLGTLTAACPAMAYSKVYVKRLEREKFLALILNNNDFEGKMHITKAAIEDLQWWKRVVPLGYNPIRVQKFNMEIYSDSSTTGWGAYCNNVRISGFWSKKERKCHINYLELKAAFLALQSFASELVSCEILLRLDNTTAIAYVNKAGGIKFPHLSELARKIWQWCEKRKIWITASYIPSSENIEADAASRITNIDTEWELSDKIFKKIERSFGPFDIDLFASRLNKKCKKFCSRFPDPDATFAKDASIGNETVINGRAVIRKAFLQKGVTEDSVDIMVNSITPSTLKQYESALKLWMKFAVEHQFDAFNSTTTSILMFLTQRFKEGAGYSTLNTTRSAIALISLYNISQDGLIARFLKDIYKKSPVRPKYASTWDITPVLTYIEELPPLNQLSFKEIAEKIATLLALTTAHRLQTLALIRVENIHVSTEGLTIKIPDLIKTSKPGKFQPELYLPYFKEKPKLCTASAILEYLEYTKKFRDNKNTRLLIATVKPYGAVSAQTIGHWIKALLNKAGIDTKQFSAYSTRHAAVSTAFRKGVDVTTIRRTAGWSAQSQTFFKFYNKPLQTSNDEFGQF
ncbi:uncharacterized protein LOC120357343 [Solenopsis invicta]|uniref:uncharacterized protein LOC120357343 n=1 Tax=Solenopsis invicta TaxID=13686 RepID=UPI00193CC0D4|nr:uncharacterized protein LOC120357343 [Solenopsis invicta]